MQLNNEIMRPEEFNDDSFRRKIKRFAGSIGKSLIEKALILYYVATDKETPGTAKTVIYGVLGYFILPLDAIPDFIPFIGYSDDLAAVVAALTLIAAHIKPRHIEKAREKAEALFSKFST